MSSWVGVRLLAKADPPQYITVLWWHAEVSVVIKQGMTLDSKDYRRRLRGSKTQNTHLCHTLVNHLHSHQTFRWSNTCYWGKVKP